VLEIVRNATIPNSDRRCFHIYILGEFPIEFITALLLAKMLAPSLGKSSLPLFLLLVLLLGKLVRNVILVDICNVLHSFLAHVFGDH
jgi:hypothetical protein